MASQTDIVPIRPLNPAELGFPPMLPVELAMRTAPVSEICAAYGLSKQDLEELAANPLFITAYQNAVEALKKDGMSFRFKAQMAAEESLKRVYSLAHDPETPKAVALDAIKSMVRWAGWDAKPDQAGGNSNNFQININLT